MPHANMDTVAARAKLFFTKPARHQHLSADYSSILVEATGPPADSLLSEYVM